MSFPGGVKANVNVVGGAGRPGSALRATRAATLSNDLSAGLKGIAAQLSVMSYDKLTTSFLAMVKLALIRRYLRGLFQIVPNLQLIRDLHPISGSKTDKLLVSDSLALSVQDF